MAAGLVGCASAKPATIRVLSYNIHICQGMDKQFDIERIAGVIRQTEPDLVALQEVDRGVERSGRADQPAELARLTGMHVVFEQNVPRQGGDYGNAVLSRYPIERHAHHFLPRFGSGEQRGMLEVHVRVDGRPLVFLATHFDHRPDDGERLASVAELRKHVAEWKDLPVIVAGDLNATPDSPVIAQATEFLHDGFTAGTGDGFTFPADEPNRRIDYILHNGAAGLEAVESCVIPEPLASDHRPLLTVFRLEAAGRGQ
ncbi:MAG: endonuclease/exonuclease/phosphatase family protein [Phycisphaerae bacterium]|nr:endonuclease/exonuclease/phosphatase family protein [Phycisphaerae bacterium]